MAEVALFSEKLKKFGTLGVGVIPDHLASMKMAEASQARKEAAKPVANGGYAAAASAPVALAPAAPAAAPEPLPERPSREGLRAARLDAAKVQAGDLTRDEILEILEETVKVQGIVQQEVSVLARKIAKERQAEKKKSRKSISFVDGHKKILELDLPKEPLESYGLSEAGFQKILISYEQDEGVMAAAQKLLHPVGKGDPDRAKSITMDHIIEIHQFMVQEMQKVLQEFLQLTQEVRRSFTGKGCETTAELLVSIAVEQQMSVRCEDVEQAVIMYEEELQNDPEFTRCTEQLANMMQHMIGAAQPRVEVEDFVRILRHMADSSKKAKVFSKKLYEDYRAKQCDVAEAYRRFATFSDEAMKALEGQDMPELSTVEMQLCYDEYRERSDVREAWEQSGVECSMMMQNAAIGTITPGGKSSSSSTPKAKGKKLKSSEIVEMQELMVDELKRTSEAVAMMSPNAKAQQWKADVAVQMVQALASAAVERRYGVSAEEMTTAGFQHAQVLQRNERFVRATEKQQEFLMRIPTLCGAAPPGVSE
eukprot:TRINITY_DN13106_c0_g1_i1.p1 TRINITY_DN13106_c0_g1~~TRINITY_DN13106_c0_g1_i1.p1  ORF type:complete len:537 (-),score=187.46 TRINITY_DN13106_c0_g1_i1:512-2122(-)